MADFQRYATGLDIVKSAMAELGLGTTTTAAGSTDLLVSQLWAKLTQAGEMIAVLNDWEQLQREWDLTTVPGQDTYALPADFNGFSDQTSWNRSSQLPTLGVTPMQWQTLKARNLGATTFALMYRQRDGQFILYNPPQTAQQLAIEYRSAGWVRDATNPNVRRDHVENDGDVVLFPKPMIKALLKALWQEAKGFDSSGAMRDFNALIDIAAARDTTAPILSLSGVAGMQLLGAWNVPETGYGGS